MIEASRFNLLAAPSKQTANVRACDAIEVDVEYSCRQADMTFTIPLPAGGIMRLDLGPDNEGVYVRARSQGTASTHTEYGKFVPCGHTLVIGRHAFLR